MAYTNDFRLKFALLLKTVSYHFAIISKEQQAIFMYNSRFTAAFNWYFSSLWYWAGVHARPKHGHLLW